ncbi:MAG TPA: hypothetical protein VHN77_03470 [Phycisphaerales bacterium]|nr:hypothetical protein [Phycisphaerales bacterium]
MPDTHAPIAEPRTPETRLKQARKLSALAQASLLREALLAVPMCGDVEKATPYAWALLELATLPAIKPSGPAWSPLRAWAERRVRAADAALAGVVACWGACGPDVRAAAMGVGKNRWEAACRTALADSRSQVRRAAARAIAEIGSPELSTIAASIVQDSDPEIARWGELALVGMVVTSRSGLWSEGEHEAWRRAADEPLWTGVVRADAGRWGLREEASLAAALASALRTFDQHRRRGVLLGALLFCDRSLVRGMLRDRAVGVLEVVTSREHPAHGPVMSLLRARALPTGRLRALEWLPFPAAKRAAVARLARADGPFDHELVLSAAHLCARPARLAALSSIKATGRTVATQGASAPARVLLPATAPLASGAVIATLTRDARRLAPLWARSIGATGPERHAALEGLLADEDPLVRMACVRHGVYTLRMDQVLDVDERVSRTAYVAWSADEDARREWGSDKDAAARRAERSRLLALFSRLPHPRVRSLAAIDRAFDSDAFSPALPIASVSGVATAYRALATDRAAFTNDLRARLSDPRNVGGGWSRAMHLARRLGVAEDVELHVRAIATSVERSADHLRNVAQAVTVLGDVATPTSHAALVSTLAHDDARVRANAVEALAKHARFMPVSALGAKPVAQPPQHLWAELKTDAHHRVRANAVRAALVAAVSGDAPRREQALFEVKADAVGSGVDALASMLSDDRTMHRLAGAWLAWKVLPAGGPLRLHERWPEMVGRIAEVAQSDAEPKVRARAARCAQLVEASLAAASMHAPGTLTLDSGI